MADLPATIAVLRELHDARPYAPARQRKALRDAIEALEEAEKVIDEMVATQSDWEAAVGKILGRQADVFPRAIHRADAWRAKYGLRR